MNQIGEITASWAQSLNLACNYQESVASTNDLAKNSPWPQPSFLVVADMQVAGRGRGQNQWLTPAPGASLLSSWCFTLEHTPQPVLSPLVGLALYRSVLATWPSLPFSLKAPNDLYLGEKKLAGILIENIQQGSQTKVIIGIGLNVFASPEDLETSTSLLEELSEGHELLGQDWISFLDRLYYELSDALSLSDLPLGSNACVALRYALNLRPSQKPIAQIQADGSILYSDSTQQHWSEL